MKIIFYLLLAYLFFNLLFNYYNWWRIRLRRRPFAVGWVEYTNITLYADDAIYPALISQISPNEKILVTVFFWLAEAESLQPLPTLALQLAEDWRAKNIQGTILFDGINVDYFYKPSAFLHPITQNLQQMQCLIPQNVYTPANNLFYWLIFNAWLQRVLNHLPFKTICKILIGLKISSNHQKIIVNVDQKTVWLGSRNFSHSSWMNNDQVLKILGPLTNAVQEENIQSILLANRHSASLAQALLAYPAEDYQQQTLTDTVERLGKILRIAEILPTIIELIKQSNSIDLHMNLLSHDKIITSLNRFIKRGGKLRVIVDPNNYTFSFKFPYLPNIIAIKRLLPLAEVRIAKTAFQMHTKSALFYTQSGTHFFLCGSANWTIAALNRYAYNDLAVVFLAEGSLLKDFQENFNNLWEIAKPREQLLQEYNNFYWWKRYWLAKLMTYSGINTW